MPYLKITFAMPSDVPQGVTYTHCRFTHEGKSEDVPTPDLKEPIVRRYPVGAKVQVVAVDRSGNPSKAVMDFTVEDRCSENPMGSPCILMTEECDAPGTVTEMPPEPADIMPVTPKMEEKPVEPPPHVVPATGHQTVPKHKGK